MHVASENNVLAKKFQDFITKHPVFIKAGSYLRDGSNSLVRFENDDQCYEWIKENGENICRPGVPQNPDLSFNFSKGSLDYLTNIRTSDVSDFITRFCECILNDDESKRIDFKVNANVFHLSRLGYMNLLLKGGPKTATLAAQHGIKSIGDLIRKLKEYS